MLVHAIKTLVLVGQFYLLETHIGHTLAFLSCIVAAIIMWRLWDFDDPGGGWGGSGGGGGDFGIGGD